MLPPVSEACGRVNFLVVCVCPREGTPCPNASWDIAPSYPSSTNNFLSGRTKPERNGRPIWSYCIMVQVSVSEWPSIMSIIMFWTIVIRKTFFQWTLFKVNVNWALLAGVDFKNFIHNYYCSFNFLRPPVSLQIVILTQVFPLQIRRYHVSMWQRNGNATFRSFSVLRLTRL